MSNTNPSFKQRNETTAYKALLVTFCKVWIATNNLMCFFVLTKIIFISSVASFNIKTSKRLLLTLKNNLYFITERGWKSKSSPKSCSF